jgi:microsomal dipeptidase-like Zn-dependent dipeptidase
VHNATTYADEIVRMCELIGPDHVAFGTDMEGAGPGAILSNYVDLRDVADKLVQARAERGRHCTNVFIGNYARIVKAAMNGAATT